MISNNKNYTVQELSVFDETEQGFTTQIWEGNHIIASVTSKDNAKRIVEALKLYDELEHRFALKMLPDVTRKARKAEKTERWAVESTWIAVIEYTERTKTFTIEKFAGGKITHVRVDRVTALAVIKDEDSVGAAYNRLIKGKFPVA